MNFSKSAEYALRVLSFMAADHSQLFAADYLHQKLHIPQRYLRRLMTELSKKGLVESTMGRYGGFTFARDPSDIFLADIIIAVEGSVFINPCIMGFEECALKNPCPIHDRWERTRKSIMDVLTTVSLTDLKDPGIIKN
jgi:Rrf2 family protein